MSRRARAWQPDGGAPDGPQRRFLVDLAGVYEVLNAGEVGSGKTDAGLMGCVAYREYRRSAAFKGLVLRHSAKDLSAEFYQRVLRPAMWPRYARGSLNETKGIYRFRTGGRVQFTTSKDLRSLQGAEYQYVWFDELTHWSTPDDYLYVLTRCRSSTGLPVRVRAGTNPGGPGHEWVKKRWGPWLAGDFLARGADGQDLYAGAAELRALGYTERYSAEGKPLPPCRSGEVLWYEIDEQTLQERYVAPPPSAEVALARGLLSRTCLRTTTAENRAMAAGDPQYKARVRAAGAVLFAQLGRDDWSVRAKEGEVFQRRWFQPIEAVPPLDGICRRWDFAYTIGADKKALKKRDWTVGLKMGWRGPAHDRHWYILHIVRVKGRPEEIRALVQQTAELDGRGVPVVVPVDYAAGHWIVADLQAALAGYVVEPHKESGAKEVRIQALAPQAQAERIHILRGAWNETFLDEAAFYPDVRNDDQLDAAAGAFLYSLEAKARPTAAILQRDVAAAGAASKALDRAFSAHADGGWGDGGDFGGGFEPSW